jgi:phenylpropionate dioxygenase-like ring-hydroxylating dioxygenase large terminal subunit
VRRKDFLRDLWYLALPARAVKPGVTAARTVLGEPLLFGRRADGTPYCLQDHCPHRAMPLRYGRQEDDAIECCYHGWKFDVGTGRCLEIPALVPEDEVDVAKIKVPVYPCREVAGALWVFLPERRGRLPETLPPVPGEEATRGLEPRVCESQAFACHFDWAVIGLMDPAHAAYVHTSWWWNTGEHVLREKEKRYEPSPLGFRLARYALTKSARPYKLLGKNVSTEITFQLPGVRVEHIRGDRHAAVDLTAITPVSETETVVHHLIYWTVPGLGALKPLARRLARQFLDQDRQAVLKQQSGIAFDDSMMFVGDADQEARWYFALKQEYLASREQGRAFQNPVVERTLRWRS